MGANNPFFRFGPFAFLMIALALFSRPALAVPILDIGPNGELFGVSGLVGFSGYPDRVEVLYDVEFKTGTFEEVFGPRQSFALTSDSPHYGYIPGQLLYRFFQEGPGDAFRYAPHLINGCEGWDCRIYSPYSVPRLLFAEYSDMMIFRAPVAEGREPYLHAEFPDEWYSWHPKVDNEVWAVWSYTSVDVPGPSSLALFALGAVGLLFRHRRIGRGVLNKLLISAARRTSGDLIKTPRENIRSCV